MHICIRLQAKDERWEEQFKALEQKYAGVKIGFQYGKETLDLKGVDALISTHLKKEELENANQLKNFFLPFTGVNNLPLEALAKRNITVTNSHANADFIAEKAFGLGLGLLGRIAELDHRFREKGWGDLRRDSMWTSHFHKKCGFLGMGEIGQHLLKLIAPFQVEIVTLTRYRSKLKDYPHVTYYDSVKEVCQQSDLTYISLPLTNQTENLIDHTILSDMKEQYIVNVGRAEVINERDLYQALKQQTLKGAAIDVWYRYPKKDEEGPVYPSQFPIHEFKNVVLSPHCSGHTKKSNLKALEDILKNVERLITNQPVLNTVKPLSGY